MITMFSFFLVQERIIKSKVDHKTVFFRALDNAVRKGDLSEYQARELRRDY